MFLHEYPNNDADNEDNHDDNDNDNEDNHDCGDDGDGDNDDGHDDGHDEGDGDDDDDDDGDGDGDADDDDGDDDDDDETRAHDHYDGPDQRIDKWCCRWSLWWLWSLRIVLESSVFSYLVSTYRYKSEIPRSRYHHKIQQNFR